MYRRLTATLADLAQYLHRHGRATLCGCLCQKGRYLKSGQKYYGMLYLPDRLRG